MRSDPMRTEEFEKKTGPGRKRLLIGIACVILLIILPVSGIAAYVTHESGIVENDFSAAVTPTVNIDETFDGQTKSDVKIRLGNDGSGRYYVRAAIVITLRDGDGNIVAGIPAVGTDYTISMGSDWTKEGNYWYYNKTLTPGLSTTDLIESCTTLNSEYKLSVDIMAQTVQAMPADAVTEAWGLTPAVID